MNRRLTSLSNAIEKFRLIGFRWTFEQLHRATGSQPNDWTPEQIDHAVQLIVHAHDSWIEYLHRSERRTHNQKWSRAYSPLYREDVFASWRAEYFDSARKALWHFDELD